MHTYIRASEPTECIIPRAFLNNSFNKMKKEKK